MVKWKRKRERKKHECECLLNFLQEFLESKEQFCLRDQKNRKRRRKRELGKSEESKVAGAGVLKASDCMAFRLLESSNSAAFLWNKVVDFQTAAETLKDTTWLNNNAKNVTLEPNSAPALQGKEGFLVFSLPLLRCLGKRNRKQDPENLEFRIQIPNVSQDTQSNLPRVPIRQKRNQRIKFQQSGVFRW